MFMYRALASRMMTVVMMRLVSAEPERGGNYERNQSIPAPAAIVDGNGSGAFGAGGVLSTAAGAVVAGTDPFCAEQAGNGRGGCYLLAGQREIAYCSLWPQWRENDEQG